MLTMKILFVTCVVICLATVGALPCPASNYRGNLVSAQIVIALDGGIIPINDGEDTQCYNYSLPYAFNTPPDVAIAVQSFQVQPTKSLYFFIKSIRSDSLSFVPFVIRTQWPYTQWNQITFSFIAEDRNDIETGYYQLDSGPLAGCENGKLVDLLLPFRHDYRHGKNIQHSVFLHGFEIATMKTEGNTRSPFEFQIVSTSANYSGIHISISVTTVTQVNSIYISYIALQETTLAVSGGGYTYDAATDLANVGLYYSPQTLIPRNFARLYGFTGFLLNYNTKRISYSTKWDGFSFTFAFGSDASLIKYFSFSYVFFTGSECQDCTGFEIFDNNACVSYCPIGTYKTPDNTCINCGPNRQYNGTNCITKCPVGQYLNNITSLCECPPTLNWNGQSCIPCLSGKVWVSTSKSCECPQGLVWNGFACARIDPCSNGKVWDVFTFSCQCPETTFWDGEKCKQLPQCAGGQTLNNKFECECPGGYVWSNNLCVFSPCIGGQVWTGSKCVCPVGLNYNGTMCLECINGQKWDSKTSTCACESGYKWNGQYCQKSYLCENGRVWSPTFQQCICPEGHYWSGYKCLPSSKCVGGQYFDTTIQKCICLSGFQWDGKICVQCRNGRVWNVTTLSCTCPFGTSQVRDGCRFQQTCTGGKQWNQNSWSCECPDNSTWDGSFCIKNPCFAGQIWNTTLKSCQCPGGKITVNGTCVPPQIACTNGRIWNPFIYACACPSGTFAQPTKCDPIPSCSNGKVYNPLNNLCQCPFGLAEVNGICRNPKCPAGQYWSSGSCQVINCPPPSYFDKDRCVTGTSNKCGFNNIWNGIQCVLYPTTCPSGTNWNGQICQGSPTCGDGYYSVDNVCTLLPQQCPPPTKWDGAKCSGPNNICPKGTYAQGSKCFPFEPCKNGFVWDPNYLRCICPPGTINNGNKCVECSNDQKWIPSVGCACPEGTFDTGASCQSQTQNKCTLILNSIWNDNKCVCRPGFTKVGFQCICYGTQNGDLCDKCSYKPNSVLNARTNICQCKVGFTQISENCVPLGSSIGNDDPNKCSVGTYFDKNHKSCLACPAGCLSCFDCYRCKLCRPEFVYDHNSEKCFELCGDGKKFNLECDDGNNFDGDGCSRDCKIETGYTCSGGSPQSKDNCYQFKPQSVKLEQIGQIRKSTSIVLNIRLNYLPEYAIKSQECGNKCNQLLAARIVEGDANALSISSQYLPGTKYVFTITIEFGRVYMGRFKINVSISNAFSKYFGGLKVQTLSISVEPSYLMSIGDSTKLEEQNKLN